MNFELLTKEQTKYVANNATPIENKINEAQGFFRRCGFIKDTATFNFQMDVTMWYHTHGLSANNIKPHWKKLEELLNCKPAYYWTGAEFKNAVWGFSYDDNKFLIYSSKRGLSIEVEDSFPAQKCIPLLKKLKELLVRGEGLYTSKVKEFELKKN